MLRSPVLISVIELRQAYTQESTRSCHQASASWFVLMPACAEEMTDFFASRRISRATLERNGIMAETLYVPADREKGRVRVESAFLVYLGGTCKGIGLGAGRGA